MMFTFVTAVDIMLVTAVWSTLVRGVVTVLTQAAIVSRKKKAAAEQLHQVREELSRTETECDEKRSQLQESGTGSEVLKGDEVFH